MYPAETAGCCVFWPRPAVPETWSSSARPGYSGLWFSLALSKTGGHLTTFDIDKGHFEMARNNFKKAGVDGIVTQVLGDAHKEMARLKDPIDLLFIDADKQGYLDSSPSCCPWFAPAA
ncbi:MAG: O-methyltransferase [Isosphaeraceae bacterium]